MGRKEDKGVGVALRTLALTTVAILPFSESALAETTAASSTDDIIVTATRRDESVIAVPLSLVAVDRARLDRERVAGIADLSRTTPGLSVRNGWGDSTKISIRGIASTVGSATTGIYIDDTPIQVRSLGQADIVANTYPEIFDLERIEVLRGPQGTLFGAGSEGGTVRFITSAPSLDGVTLYGKASVSSTRGGAASWSAGGSASAPLVVDKVGITLTAFSKKDGGWLDRAPNDPGGVTVDDDINRRTATSLRGAMAFAPSETVTVTPSIFYQKTHRHDTDQYWEALSDPRDDQYVSGAIVQQPSNDRFYLPALKVEAEFGGARLITNTSWFDRRNRSTMDYSYHTVEGLSYILTQGQFVLHNLLPADFQAPSHFRSSHKAFTHEMRLQSSDPEARLSWTAGVFYQWSRQKTQQTIVAPQFPTFMSIFTSFLPPLPAYLAPLTNPTLLPGDVSYASADSARDTQLAGFGQVDWKATDRLTLTLGGRIARTKVSFDNSQDGPLNFGPSASSGSQKETPFTPKVGASYKPDDASLIYASAAKGFRTGGGNTSVPALCGADLALLGLSAVPSTYESDSVWSYEAGVKKGLNDNSLNVQASAFLIDWKNIQQSVPLFQCGFAYTANLGKAVSKGFDVQLSVKPVDGLTLRGSVAYTDAHYTRTVVGGSSNAVLVTKGDELPGPPWQVRLSGAYEFTMADNATFVQVDYDYASAYQRLPTAFNTDTTIADAEATHFVGARAGVTVGQVQASLFVDNLLNSRDALFRTRDSVASDYYRRIGFRPRTVGIELIFRN